MKTNDQIAEEIAKDKQRQAAEETKPAKIAGSQVTGAKIAWMLGAFVVDISTAYAIGVILFWWYGVAWIIAGAGGIVYSDWLRERVGNNDIQKKIASTGLSLSWLAIVLMAIMSGVVLVLEMTKNRYIEGFTILFVIGLFLYHVFQSYRYSINDDEYIEQTKEARANELTEKRIREIHRAARIVQERKKANNLIEEYAQEHGAAILAALGEQTEVKAFASETEGVSDVQTTNPTQAGKNKQN